MQNSGLSLATRYSYPPNSLSFCGPAKQKDLQYYSSEGIIDTGAREILSQFATLYPYLCLIAYHNNIRDPFSRAVVEAYWLGNTLLHPIPKRQFANHLKDTVGLKKTSKTGTLLRLLEKLDKGALPNHSFHVLNVYRRTGHLDILHTIETMDACMINWGRIIENKTGKILVETRPLRINRDNLILGEKIIRKLMPQGTKDRYINKLKVGDIVSYHWGYICQKLTDGQLKNLKHYTKLALLLANEQQSHHILV